MNNILLILIGILIIFILYKNNNKTETFIEDREDGHTYISPSIKEKNVNISADKNINLTSKNDMNLTSNQNILKSNNNQLIGQELSSHFPSTDGNTYIRPGKKNGSIAIDNAKNINLCSDKLCSHLPWTDGHSYIRPGEKGKNINIDHAHSINLGSTQGFVTHLPHNDGNTYFYLEHLV
jgi:hypothetical protein